LEIPGIPSVGPQTAAKWLAQYGTLGQLLYHSEKIGRQAGEN
jgi:DNA polymerase I